MKRIKIKVKDIEKIIEVNEGDNLLQVLREQGYTINASCGGVGQCKKCMVLVNGEKRLSCQTIITEDMKIELEDLLHTNQNIMKTNSGDHYHVAIDIGTTTLAGYLIDLDHKEINATYSITNPQISYGADVITRIKACSLGHLEHLHHVIIQAVNDLIMNLMPQGIPKYLIVSGNPVMLHILMKEDPTSIGKYPYTAKFLEKKEFSGDLLNIKTNKVILLPSISSFIGADIVAGCLYIVLLQEKKNVLFIDLGTNGEIILKVEDQLYGTSTAAGPAFEGAMIEKGLGGVKGAISKVSYLDKLIIETISDKPQGICGSGLIDIIAILRKEQILDETGRLVGNPNSPLISNLQDDKFYLTDEVYITQKDIREFQLAKSAITSGIKILLEQAQCPISSLDKVWIAGGFGFYMNKESAIQVGLLPHELEDKMIVIGNSSGLGSVMVAYDHKWIHECEEIAKKVITVDLTKAEKFNQVFMENMYFI